MERGLRGNRGQRAARDEEEGSPEPVPHSPRDRRRREVQEAGAAAAAAPAPQPNLLPEAHPVPALERLEARENRRARRDGRDDVPDTPAGRPEPRQFLQRRDAPYEVPDDALYRQMQHHSSSQNRPDPRCWNDPPMVAAGGSTGGMRGRTLSRRVLFPLDGIPSHTVAENLNDCLEEVMSNLKVTLDNDEYIRKIDQIREYWMSEHINHEVKAIVIKLSRHIRAREYLPSQLLLHQLLMHHHIEWLHELLTALAAAIKPVAASKE